MICKHLNSLNRRNDSFTMQESKRKVDVAISSNYIILFGMRITLEARMRRLNSVHLIFEAL